jgi:hypothetical protein
MDTGAALGGTGLFISVLGVIYGAVNHKQIKTRCCGKVYDMSIDIGSTEHGGEKKTEIVGEEKEPKKEPKPKEEPKKEEFVYKSRINRVAPHFDI